MNEIFKMPDSYRQSVELEAAHAQEIRDRLVFDGENKLISKLLSTFGNGRILESSQDSLAKVAGQTSTDFVFDGTITVIAEVTDQNGTKRVSFALPVKENNVELLNDEDLKKLVADAETKRMTDEVIEVASAFPLRANLDGFRLYDDGSDYFRVYHPTLDTGKELGIIGKDEYNSLQNKEAFFKEVLENQVRNSILENHYDLSFEGEFKEPIVETVEIEHTITAVVSEKKEQVTKTPSIDEPVGVEERKCRDCGGPMEPGADAFCDACSAREAFGKQAKEAEEDSNFLAHQADSYRQVEEFEQQKTQADLDRLAIKLSNDLVSHLQALKYDAVKVISVDNTDATAFKVIASLIDNAGDKIVTFTIPVREDVYTLPKKEVVAELISSVEDLQSKIAASFAEEALARMKAIDESEQWIEKETEAALKDEKIEKTAGGEAGGLQFIGPIDVLNIEKHTLNLPDDTEIGSKIFADGFTWQLVSKDQNNLGKEADGGSIWTFHKIPPENKKPETEVIS